MVASEAIEQLALVGIPQIAKIANVGRSAVGNWRKRHADFPAAKVQTPSGALFDLREVEDWLIEQGKISQRAPASARLWGLADAARGVWMPEEFVTFSASCLVYLEACARARGDDPSASDLPRPRIPKGAAWSVVRTRPPDEFLDALTKAARSIESANPELEGLLDPRPRDQDPSGASRLAHQVAMTLDAATDKVSTRSVLFEALADLEALDRFAGEFSTPGDVASLVARLANFRGGTIVDPAVGKGRLLLQAALQVRDSARESQAVGIDVNQEAWRRARSRFYVHGHDAEIRHENALTADLDSLPLADTVVLDPPYGLGNWADAELYLDSRWQFGPPPPSSADFGWLQLATFRLKPTGRAAVLMGTASLTRTGREGAIRQRMVEAGVVEAILLLPPRLRTNTSIPLALWLLRSPAAGVDTEDVLLVDASELGATGRSRFSLPQPSIDRLVDVVSRWREQTEISTADAEIAATASLAQVLDADASLNPSRYRSAPEVDLGAVREKAQALRHSLAESSAAASKAYVDLLTYLEGRQ